MSFPRSLEIETGNSLKADLSIDLSSLLYNFLFFEYSITPSNVLHFIGYKLIYGDNVNNVRNYIIFNRYTNKLCIIMKKIDEMSEIELLRLQVKIQQESLLKLKSINGWMIFFGVVTILAILVFALITNQ